MKTIGDGFSKYVVTVRHDGGRVRILTAANNTGGAIRLVMLAENCPRSAIVSCRMVKGGA